MNITARVVACGAIILNRPEKIPKGQYPLTPSIYTDRRLFSRLLRQARPFWAHIAGIFLLGMLATPLMLLAPLPLTLGLLPGRELQRLCGRVRKEFFQCVDCAGKHQQQHRSTTAPLASFSEPPLEKLGCTSTASRRNSPPEYGW